MTDSFKASVTGRNDVRVLHHQDDGALRCSCSVDHSFGHGKPFPRSQLDDLPGLALLRRLEVDEETPIEDEEKLVVGVVLVPVILALDHSEADNGVVDPD